MIYIDEARSRYLDNPEKLLRELCPPPETIVDFLREIAKRVVVGLSGGVDSSLAAALAVKALGKENVFGLIMPAGNLSMDAELALEHARKMGIAHEVIDLAEPAAAVKNNGTAGGMFDDNAAAGNLKARLRMIHLYAKAASLGALVMGTGNKSELITGYFTKYGDGGTDILPLSELYKTQVWMLAEQSGIPELIVKRPPTAGLWAGQTDEGEMGITYRELDLVLLGLDLGYDAAWITKASGIPADRINIVLKRVHESGHKRSLPPRPAAIIDRPDPAEHARRYPCIRLTVDAVVKHNDRYVFVRRGADPFKGLLALPGGHVEYNENCENAVVREIEEETGLAFRIEGLLGVYSNPGRDPRGHYATVVFYGPGTGALKAGDDAGEVVLLTKNQVGDLAFDHSQIWRDYERWVEK